MRKKYYVDRMIYTLHNRPVKGQKEYWETVINPIVMRTNNLDEAMDRYHHEVNTNKDKYVEIILFKRSNDEDEVVESFSTLDPDIKIRIQNG